MTVFPAFIVPVSLYRTASDVHGNSRETPFAEDNAMTGAFGDRERQLSDERKRRMGLSQRSSKISHSKKRKFTALSANFAEKAVASFAQMRLSFTLFFLSHSSNHFWMRLPRTVPTRARRNQDIRNNSLSERRKE